MDNLEIILSREYWITQQGERKYPHEFNDEHLINTIRYLHRATKKIRLESARNLCELINKTSNSGIDIGQYYSRYKRQMDNALCDLNDEQWLNENSKIYRMLVEESKFRNLKIVDEPTKKKYTGSILGKYDLKSKFSFIFNA